MVKDAPHITLTIGRDADGEKTTGEIGMLGLGFGIFQAWLYMAIFSVIRVFDPSEFTGFNFFLSESMANSILYTFLITSAITLIFIGISNQRYLRFYVSKLAMRIGASLCSVGTLLVFLACLPCSPDATAALATDLNSASLETNPMFIKGEFDFSSASSLLSLTASLISGACMGIGSSLLVALWGTGFARSKFTTIVLNAAFSIPLGVIVAFLFIIWIPSPISGIITACLPLLAIVFLKTLTPKPFYQRREQPIFNPFPSNRTSYIVRIGIPTVIIGIVLGALRIICVGEVLPSGTITIQLILGAACCMSVIIFVSAIGISRKNPYWDTLFRSIVPIIVIGAASIPFIASQYAVPAAFLISTGYLSLEILLWIFYADLSNRFSLSPLFVFGIGRGILEIAGVLGSALAQLAFRNSVSDLEGLTLLALICATLMSIGYSVLPRHREFKGIVDEAIMSTDVDVETITDADSEAGDSNASLENRSLESRPLENLESHSFESRPDAVPHTPHTEPAESTYELPPQLVQQFGDQAGHPQVISTSQTDGETEPLLAVDGIAEEAEKSTAATFPLQQNVTPPGTDTVITNAAIGGSDTENGESTRDGNHEKGSFHRRCDEISERYMLSKREREVLPLLAKGHNAAFIQDQLCVSKSTAKTHINHIYKKLDIHTQQELLNMVEDRRRGPRNSGTVTPSTESGKMLGNNYMLDRNAFEKAVNEAASHPTESRPKAKRGYRTSIFKD